MNNDTFEETDHEENYESEPSKNMFQYNQILQFRDAIRAWRIENNISHTALKSLATLINTISPNLLPVDPRTLMNTPRQIDTINVNPGQYWHNGLIIPLETILKKIDRELPANVSLYFNIDGLPVCNSSKQQFWPILCKIFELPSMNPFIVGIYAGNGKPNDLNAYLQPFVQEMLTLLQNGLLVKNNKVNATIRCFVCDSPARAMIKGICNFNGKHGCNKCTIIGEYSHVSHTVIFPELDCPARKDEDFRKKLYGKHHKVDSPLLSLPIDMIKSFPVADSMHLIDLGIMKRLLIGWRDGNFGKKDTKLRASDISTVNVFLDDCKVPTEIHRSVRNLSSLGHWKASEFRTFLLYLSIVILPEVLNTGAMRHFLSFFCAITICSSEEYFNFLPLAKELLDHFVKNFKSFYGIDYMTSNVHNLLHVVDEVLNFGILQSFNAYPFENKLYLIKNMLRTGNKPLSQIAKRLGECDSLDLNSTDEVIKIYPYVKKNCRSGDLVLHFKDFIISKKNTDRFFVTSNQEIMETRSIEVQESKIIIKCNLITNTENVFEHPISSSYLKIFKYKLTSTNVSECIRFPEDLKYKLVAIKYKNEMYLLPLLHTFSKC